MQMLRMTLKKFSLFLIAMLPASALAYKIMAKLTQETLNESDGRDHGGPPSDF